SNGTDRFSTMMRTFLFTTANLSLRAIYTDLPEHITWSPVPSAWWESYSPARANSGDSRNSRCDPACDRSSMSQLFRPTRDWLGRTLRKRRAYQSPANNTEYPGEEFCGRNIWECRRQERRGLSSTRNRSSCLHESDGLPWRFQNAESSPAHTQCGSCPPSAGFPFRRTTRQRPGVDIGPYIAATGLPARGSRPHRWAPRSSQEGSR